MNKIIDNKKIIQAGLLLITAVGFLLGVTGIAEAQTPAPAAKVANVNLVGMADAVTKTIPKLIYNALVGFYTDALLPAYTDIIYEIDPQIPDTVTNNSALSANQTTVNQAVANDSAAIVSNSFASIQDQYKASLTALQKEIAEDDYVSGVTTVSSLYGGSTDAFPTKQQAEKGNAIFNAASLIGTDSYSDTASVNNAQGYLVQLQRLAPPPPVIRLSSDKFEVPIQDIQNPSKNSVTIGPLKSEDIVNIKNALNENPAYRTYKQAYRSFTAIRSLLFSLLDRVYQERIPHNGVSLLQARDQQINSRLTPDYYKAMSKASPATVAREQLFLLAQISSQLNSLMKQNQKLMLLQSIDSLTRLSIVRQTMDNQAKQIGKLIYCQTDQGKKDALCKQQSPASAAGVPAVS